VPLSDQSSAAEVVADVEQPALTLPHEQASQLDPAVQALCTPLSDNDPCGPDLDRAGDAEYLNFLAHVEGILPTSFFSLDDGKPFDQSTIDLNGQLAAVDHLLVRSRDVRLLTIRARLLILNRDLAGFSVTIAAIAEWLDGFWDVVHPQPREDDVVERKGAISALDLPTVIFPLQYTPLFEGRRIGTVTYRAWMVATGDIKPRAGDVAVAAAALAEAVQKADPTALAAARRQVTLLSTSLDRIQLAFDRHGDSADLDGLSALVRKMRAFIDPQSSGGNEAGRVQVGVNDPSLPNVVSASGEGQASPLTSIADAKQALSAIADYYSQSEPSSPALPLVRQARLLIGKSFLEIMTILVPTQVEKAAFQIGTNPVFDLPVNKLSFLSANPTDIDVSIDTVHATGGMPPPLDHGRSRYRIESRAQALSLLDSVQRYFRHSEPSSPVPMLCERARALAERDFMGVLEDVLPKSALKALNSDR
jgi:type VI secretion system protein ImpA